VILETLDNRVDPVGACVGQRGARITAIVSELNKEKIDIIQQIDEPRMFITRLLGIKTEYSIDINEEEKTADIIIPDSIEKDVFGVRNANLELSEQISGYKLNVSTESTFNEANELRIQDVAELNEELKSSLIENEILTADGFFKKDKSEVLEIEGIDEDIYNFIKTALDSYYKE